MGKNLTSNWRQAPSFTPPQIHTLLTFNTIYMFYIVTHIHQMVARMKKLTFRWLTIFWWSDKLIPNFKQILFYLNSIRVSADEEWSSNNRVYFMRVFQRVEHNPTQHSNDTLRFEWIKICKGVVIFKRPIVRCLRWVLGKLEQNDGYI